MTLNSDGQCRVRMTRDQTGPLVIDNLNSSAPAYYYTATKDYVGASLYFLRIIAEMLIEVAVNVTS